MLEDLKTGTGAEETGYEVANKQSPIGSVILCPLLATPDAEILAPWSSFSGSPVKFLLPPLSSFSSPETEVNFLLTSFFHAAKFNFASHAEKL